MRGEQEDRNPIKGGWVGYWALIIQQAQNAFNDKAAQFFLISLGGAIGFAVESWAGIMIALPFVLFAPLAGWFSDRFSKRNVIVSAAIAQVTILCLMCGAVMIRNMPLALIGFFLLAIQSAFFSPAKMGINKELVGSKNLGFASGVQQMTAILAILSGQILAGWWYDQRYVKLGSVVEKAWDAALFPIFLLACFSGVSVFIALLIPKVKAHSSEPLSLKLLVGHFQDLTGLWAEPALRRASLGVAFFWGYAAFLNLWSVKVAKFLTDGGEGFGTLSSVFMAAASLGLAIGFGLSAYLLRKRIELGWVPPAGMLMVLSLTVLIFIPMDGAVFLGAIGVAAFSGGMFLSPLNAWMQDHYPADKRGEMQSAVNLQDCLAGLLTIFFIEGMLLLTRSAGFHDGLGFRIQMAIFSLLSLGVNYYFVRLYLSDFIRLTLLFLIRRCYRIQAVGLDRLPKDGGVLLLPNHVTFADAFFISAVIGRRVRFVMDETYMGNRVIAFSAKLFGTVPIRRDKPLEAMRKIIEVLDAGEVVALFPEGQLTRTGGLSEIERGFELIARKANAPMLPIWLDGSWGSIFSFERERYFRKKPYRIPYALSAAVGNAIAVKKPKVSDVQHALLRASAEAITERCGNDAMARNAHQLTQTVAIPRRVTIHLLKGEELAILGVIQAFTDLTNGKLVRHDAFDSNQSGIWLGGDKLRAQITSDCHKVKYYDFSKSAQTPLSLEGLTHFPCLAVDGLIISLSMGHPPKANAANIFQPGNKESSYGKLLPGWYVENEKIMPGNLPLPEGFALDLEGFLVRDLRV